MKSSVIYQKIGENNYSIISCSIMGEGKIENQDSVKIYNDENQIIVVVADGLGSAIYSKEGSQKIATIACELLAKKSDLSEIALELQNKWKCGLKGNINLYDTTIKFIKITENDVFYGGIGDGWIAFNTNKGFIDIKASNSFSNQTDTILSFDLRNKFRIEKIASKIFMTALISTDGFSEDIDKENGGMLLSSVSEHIKGDIKKFKKDIEDTLSNWPVETNKDDKTIVFIEKE